MLKVPRQLYNYLSLDRVLCYTILELNKSLEQISTLISITVFSYCQIVSFLASFDTDILLAQIIHVFC